MGDLSTYTVHDLVVMAESAGSHPECQQVPLAAIVREIERRIEEMDRAVVVLASSHARTTEALEARAYANNADGPSFMRVRLAAAKASEAVHANPLAIAAIEKARKAD